MPMTQKRRLYLKEWRKRNRERIRERYRDYFRQYYQTHTRKPYQPKPRTDQLLIDPRGAFGRKYEILTTEILPSAEDLNSSNSKNHGPDVLWMGRRIDVKARHPHRLGYYNFTTNRVHCDYFFLYCIDKNERIERIYVVPAFAFGLGIRIHATSKYDKYLVMAPQQ
jgi:hypothetical protein